MIHDEEYEKHYSPDGEHIEYLMENPQSTQPQEEWEQEWDRIAPASVESNGIVYDLQPIMIPLKQFIKNLISEIREEEYQRRRKEKGMTAKAGDEMCEIRLRKREAEIRKEERELVIDEIRRKVPKMCVVCEPKFTKITAKMYSRTN
jgi:hypothetical protein